VTFHRRARFTGRTRSPPILSVFRLSFVHSSLPSFISHSIIATHSPPALSRWRRRRVFSQVLKDRKEHRAPRVTRPATQFSLFISSCFHFVDGGRSLSLRRGGAASISLWSIISHSLCVFSVDLFIFGEFTGDQGAQGAQGSQGAQGDQGLCALIARDAPAEKFKHTRHHAIHFVSHFAATRRRRSSFAE
jgi:hypothetical protein